MFLDVFVVDSLKKIHPLLPRFSCFCLLLLFSNEPDPRYDFCSATSGASAGALSDTSLQGGGPPGPEIMMKKDEKKKVWTILITNCFTNGFLYKS